jgi:hypothetical protein
MILRAGWLTPQARLLYGILLSYCWDKDFCHPSEETLSKDLGLSRPQVDKYVKELEVSSLIKIKRQGWGKPNFYFVDKNPGNGLPDVKPALHQDVKPALHEEYSFKNIQYNTLSFSNGANINRAPESNLEDIEKKFFDSVSKKEKKLLTNQPKGKPNGRDFTSDCEDRANPSPSCNCRTPRDCPECRSENLKLLRDAIEGIRSRPPDNFPGSPRCNPSAGESRQLVHQIVSSLTAQMSFEDPNGSLSHGKDPEAELARIREMNRRRLSG